MSERSILVTGGAGYIGSHTCKALAQAGYVPVTYDNLSQGHEWAVQWGPLERGDIRDGTRLREVLERYRPLAAVHFAGSLSVAESVRDPALYYDNNVAGTMRLVNELRTAGVNRVVFSSTAAVYGTPASVPIAEPAPLQPINPYGRSKLMIEQLLSDYASAYDEFSAVALRYFNAAGADASSEIGEAHDPETHLVPLMIAAAQGRGTRLTLFGEDYPTADGTCVRDYIHVSDLADAHLRAVELTGRDRGFHALNLGVGRGYSVREMLDAVHRVTGRPVPHDIGPRRAGDPAELVADSRQARTVLGWEPRHSDLETIISTAWEWSERKSAI